MKNNLEIIQRLAYNNKYSIKQTERYIMNYSSIVPVELQEELIAIRDRYTLDSFRIGDIVNQVLVFCAENKLVVERHEIYAAVGSFVGKAARTVREYNYLAMFFPYHIREKYGALSFDHFRAASRLGENWQEALDWALESGGNGTRPATVDATEFNFSPKPTGLPDQPTQFKTPERPPSLPDRPSETISLKPDYVLPGKTAESVFMQEENPRARASEINSYVAEFQNRVNRLRDILDLIPDLSGMERVSVAEAIRVIENVIKKHVETTKTIEKITY